jgi:hypothetical protein
MDQRTEAGIGVRVQRDRGAGRCAPPASPVTSRVWARLAQFEIHLALFEQVFLQIFELKWSKR